MSATTVSDLDERAFGSVERQRSRPLMRAHPHIYVGVASARVSELERCVLVDGSLLHRYRDRLDAASSEDRWKTLELGLDGK